MDDLLQQLRAAGEPSRLRILAVLARSELTVSELCRVVDQSQPRVSRHLKLLTDAGLLERHAEGARAFYRVVQPGTDGRRFLDVVLPLLGDDDSGVADTVLERDRQRLDVIRADRAAEAARWFETIADDWNDIRRRHVGDEAVEQAMLDAVGPGAVGRLLDIGTGTGRVLELFAERIDVGLGIDLSPRMLELARSRIDESGLTHCGVHRANVYDLDVAAGTVDVAVLHHVLHFLDEPDRAVFEAARTLAPGGRLLVVDFAPHRLEELRIDHAHRRLGFAEEEVGDWLRRAGLGDVVARHLPGPADEDLTVTLWSARAAERLGMAS